MFQVHTVICPCVEILDVQVEDKLWDSTSPSFLNDWSGNSLVGISALGSFQLLEQRDEEGGSLA